ncbi:MAG TPA: histidine kinase [Chitinophagaceae bacterium]|nr:histidine kinase [Chitinophagaceae bacterium]
MHRVIFLSIILQVATTLKAQYAFSYLKIQDGLSSHTVNSIYKDADGFIWMGTNNGLNRYDGSGFKVYNHSKKTLPVEVSEIIKSVRGTGSDSLWIATSDGVTCYNKSSGNFIPVVFRDSKENVIDDLTGHFLLKDHFSRLWAFTSAGIFIIRNHIPEPVSALNTVLKKINYLPTYFGTVVFDSVRNGLWIGTTDGLYFYNFKTNGVESKQNNPSKLSIFQKETISAVTLDKKNDLWYSNSRIKLTRYRFSDNSAEVWDKAEAMTGMELNCRNLFADSKNRLWISSWQKKSFVLHPDGKVDMSTNDPGRTNQLKSVFVNDIYFEEETGTIWTATPDAVVKLQTESPVQKLIEPSTDNDAINSFKKQGNTIVVAKENGLFFYNEITGDVQHFTIKSGTAKANRFFEIEPVDGEWWCGTGKGINIFNPQTKSFRQLTGYRYADSVNKISVTHLVKDRKGNIWFAAWDDAVYRFDPVTKECIRFDGSLPDHGDIQPINCLVIKEDSDGRIWIGFGDKGVRVFSYEKNRFFKITSDKNIDLATINSISEDSKKNIWLSGIGNGIYQLGGQGEMINHFTSATGMESNFAYGLSVDAKDRVWYGSGNRIYYLNPATGTMSTLNYESDIPLDNAWPYIRFEKELGYFAVNSKILLIDEKQITRTTKLPVPLISSVSVFEKEIFFSQEKPRLTLAHRDNFFTIEFSSPMHKELAFLQYAYKLEGVNSDWVYCGRRQVASFTNVPSGNYKFLIKTTDANGIWSNDVKTVSITIRPPFWKTAWFISLVAVLAAAVVFWLYRLKKRKKQKENIDKTIDYFANTVYGENSVNEICWDIARNCISQLRFEDCVVYLMDRTKNRLVQKASYDSHNPRGHEIDNPVDIEMDTCIAGAVAQNGKPLLLADSSKNKLYTNKKGAHLSELAVPILHDNKVIGVIDSVHRKKNFFTEDHLKALTTIASISANKIAEAQAAALVKENEIKLLEINKMLAESQLMALRAQMNPHFVFNCLNSIQECIVTQKYGEASNYLNKFSKLFRMVLNNSGKNLVTLDEEAEVLRLYLELELMRFEKSFAYSIKTDEKLDSEELLIPSMLVQPYVENALWHGLMHKEGERNLLIAFEKISDEVYRCIIDDNGIGRKKSFELKEQQSKTKRHESKGLKISKDRLDVLQKQGYHATLQITDKYDEQQKPLGTTIVIELSTDLMN